MSNLKGFACLAFAINAVSTAAETRCPGNVVSVPYYGHAMVVEDCINHIER